MKREQKSADLSLYCKQRTLESWHEFPWACGFSSIVTAMRLLGDRTIRADQLPRRLRRRGADPKDGIDTGELLELVRESGYTVRSFPQRTRSDPGAFKEWLRAAWSRHHPAVVACGGGDAHDHYVVAFANPDDSWVWVMDPNEKDEVFSSMRWREFLDWTEDRTGEFCIWEGHEISRSDPPPNAVPPSTRLFEWVNELPGDVEDQDFVAAAFIDNLASALAPFWLGASASGGAPLADVLAPGGPLAAKLEEWDAYYDGDDAAALAAMLEVARDLDAHRPTRVVAGSVPALTAELALLLVHTLKLHRELEAA